MNFEIMAIKFGTERATLHISRLTDDYEIASVHLVQKALEFGEYRPHLYTNTYIHKHMHKNMLASTHTHP